jgi:hypothetical protein
MEYKFHENKDLSQWLDDRLKEFRTIDTRSVYNNLHQMRFDHFNSFIKCIPTSCCSHEREPTQANLTQFANPWNYSFKAKNASKGKFARLGSRVRQSMAPMEEKKKDTIFALLKTLAL